MSDHFDPRQDGSKYSRRTNALPHSKAFARRSAGGMDVSLVYDRTDEATRGSERNAYDAE